MRHGRARSGPRVCHVDLYPFRQRLSELALQSADRRATDREMESRKPVIRGGRQLHLSSADRGSPNLHHGLDELHRARITKHLAPIVDHPPIERSDSEQSVNPIARVLFEEISFLSCIALFNPTKFSP